MYSVVDGADHVLLGLASQWTRRRLLLFRPIPLLVTFRLRGFKNSVIWDCRMVALLAGLLLGDDEGVEEEEEEEDAHGVQVKRASRMRSGRSATKSKFQRCASAWLWRCSSWATNWAWCTASWALRAGPKRQRLTRDRHASPGLTRDSPLLPPPPIIMARTSNEMGAAKTCVVIFSWTFFFSVFSHF